MNAKLFGKHRRSAMTVVEILVVIFGVLLTNRNGRYEYRGKVMVWSRGPDGKVSSSQPANSGANKDNVVSWQ